MPDDDDQLPPDPDHPEVRDLSYERSRSRQMYDLLKDSLIDFGWPEKLENPHDPATWPKDRLELYVKQRARGVGYVADFVYTSRDLPVRVYGILINRGKGLEVAELELFRLDWGYQDGQADDPDDEPAPEPESLITSDLLRKIPLGTIVARAQPPLPRRTGETKVSSSSASQAPETSPPRTSCPSNSQPWRTRPPRRPARHAAAQRSPTSF